MNFRGNSQPLILIILSLCNTIYCIKSELWDVAEFNYGDILDIKFYDFMESK